MASVERLPSGRFRGVYRDSAGRKQHTKPFERKRDALDAANEAEVRAKRQAAAQDGTLSAKTTINEWWDILLTKREFQSDTGRNEASIYKNHIRTHWGDTALNKVRRAAVQDWVDSYNRKRTDRGQRYKPASVHKFYGVLAIIINNAVRAEILTASPLVGIDLPKIPKRDKTYLTVDEGAALGKTLRADYADMTAFEMETGLRPSELAGLHNCQVDEAKKILTVRYVYVRLKKVMRDYPKDLDERTIPLTARALEIYQRATAGRDMSRPCGRPHINGEPCPGDVVFRTEQGKVVDIGVWKTSVKRAAARAGIEHRNLYDMRRGFATKLRENGADPFMIKEVMGHEKLEQTHEYAQPGPTFGDTFRAVMGEAPTLRIVGQDEARGTDRGTRPGSQAFPEVPRVRRARPR